MPELFSYIENRAGYEIGIYLFYIVTCCILLMYSSICRNYPIITYDVRSYPSSYPYTFLSSFLLLSLQPNAWPLAFCFIICVDGFAFNPWFRIGGGTVTVPNHVTTFVIQQPRLKSISPSLYLSSYNYTTSRYAFLYECK